MNACVVVVVSGQDLHWAAFPPHDVHEMVEEMTGTGDMFHVIQEEQGREMQELTTRVEILQAALDESEKRVQELEQKDRENAEIIAAASQLACNDIRLAVEEYNRIKAECESYKHKYEEAQKIVDAWKTLDKAATAVMRRA